MSMIETKNGDVLAIDEGIIVHGCNCRGVMGGGIALQVKQRFPEVYQAYINVHTGGFTRGAEFGLKLGMIIPIQVGARKWIVNAMTQDGYGTDKRYVSYDAVADCFEKVNEFAVKMFPECWVPICFPKIGAGLAGGNWEIIEQIIDTQLDDQFEKVLYVYP